MIGVGGVAVSGHFAINAGTAFLSMFEIFEHDHPSPFAHDKPIAFSVEWP